MSVQQALLAIRVKDGIFVGNNVASKDQEFLRLNKVTRIVNCAGSDIGNAFQGEIAYMTFCWQENNGSHLFPVPEDARRVKRFIDASLDSGECVLVHSVKGMNRASSLVIAYLMTRYGWCCDSATDFVTTAHPDTRIEAHFMKQLEQLGQLLTLHGDKDILHPDIDTSSFSLDNEQWCLRNTYLNSLCLEPPLPPPEIPDKAKSRTRVTFGAGPAAGFSSKRGGSILTTRQDALRHPIASSDGDTCPMGPWPMRPGDAQGEDYDDTPPPAPGAEEKAPPAPPAFTPMASLSGKAVSPAHTPVSGSPALNALQVPTKGAHSNDKPNGNGVSQDKQDKQEPERPALSSLYCSSDVSKTEPQRPQKTLSPPQPKRPRVPPFKTEGPLRNDTRDKRNSAQFLSPRERVNSGQHARPTPKYEDPAKKQFSRGSRRAAPGPETGGQYMRRGSPMPLRPKQQPKREPVHNYSFDSAHVGVARHSFSANPRGLKTNADPQRGRSSVSNGHASPRPSVSPRPVPSAAASSRVVNTFAVRSPRGKKPATGTSGEFPTPRRGGYTDRANSGTHLPPSVRNLHYEPRQAPFHVIGSNRNYSPSNRLLRPTENTSARTRVRTMLS